MNSECVRIADQLSRALDGDPWHGSPLRDLLDGLTAEQARTRPMPAAHSIGELVLHMELYLRLALDATRGVSMPKLYGTENDWPAAADSPEDWAAANNQLFHSGEQLAHAIEGFADTRLADTVPGRAYDFYNLFHGVVQHSLYHGGQIALLRKALSHGPVLS
jgi:uncharacterized damage-inducible protein DinB